MKVRAIIGITVIGGLFLSLWAKEKPKPPLEEEAILLTPTLSVEARKFAAHRLGRKGAVDVLVKGLEVNKESPEVMVEIVKALNDTRSEQAIPGLTNAFDWNVAPEVDSAILEALYNIKPTTVVEPCEKALGPERPELHKRASQLLAIVLEGKKDTSAITALYKAYKGEKSEEVRFAIVNAIGKIDGPTAVDPLIQALSDPDSLIRNSSAQFLGEMKEPKAIQALGRLLSDTTCEGCQKAAAEALWKIADPKVFPALINGLDNRWTIRRFVFNLLDKSKVKEAIPCLVDSLASSRKGIVSDLQEILIHQYNRFGLFVIENMGTKLKKSKDPNLQKIIAELLSNFPYQTEAHSKVAVDYLGKIISEPESYPDVEARIIISKAIGNIGSAAGYYYLSESLKKEKESMVRRQDIKSLYQIAIHSPGIKENVVFTLNVYGLGDPDFSVVGEAIRVLSDLGNKSSLPLLKNIELSQNYPNWVRVEARKAINNIEKRIRE